MRMLVVLTALIFLFLFGAFLFVELNPVAFGSRADDVAKVVAGVSGELWRFLRPLLQLAILFLILEVVWRRAGIGFDFKRLHIEWNIRAIIAMVIIFAFCIAALMEIPGIGNLKDVALVVIGFYFGGLTRKPDQPDAPPGEIEPAAQKPEEHGKVLETGTASAGTVSE